MLKEVNLTLSSTLLQLSEKYKGSLSQATLDFENEKQSLI
jgi:hypothetical protein